MSLIEIDNLTRGYGRRRGVSALSLHVPDGSMFGFLGPNGAGKTTTIRVLMGLLRPQSGSARIFRRDCWRDSWVVKRDVGYLSGDLQLYRWMNGHDALHIFGRARGMNLRQAGGDLAERFQLDLRVKVRRMSRGMKQKLGLILAMAHRPRLLILDEPSSGLDPLMQVLLKDHLRQLAGQGHTVFFSSHTLSEVEQLCDRVAIIRDGVLAADQSLDHLRNQAGYEVYLRWKSAEEGRAVAVPEFFAMQRKTEDSWFGLVRAEVTQLADWVAGKPVADMSIGRPDLESVFRQYYRSEDANR